MITHTLQKKEQTACKDRNQQASLNYSGVAGTALCNYIFIFIHRNMLEKKKAEKCSNKKEAHKDTFIDCRTRRKSVGKQSLANEITTIHREQQYSSNFDLLHSTQIY